MPDLIDLRHMLGPVRWQGYRGTCLAFATSAAQEASIHDTHGMLDTCEEYVYWASKQHDVPGPGTTFTSMRDGLSVYGHPLEESWPYDPSRDDQAATYLPPAGAHVSQPRWSPAFGQITASEAEVRSELGSGRVVVLGIPTWPDLDTPADGRLSVPEVHELDGAYHAVAVVGYDESTTSLLIRNSWGESWGSEGCAWLPVGFLSKHACEAWTLNASAAGHQLAGRTAAKRYG